MLNTIKIRTEYFCCASLIKSLWNDCAQLLFRKIFISAIINKYVRAGGCFYYLSVLGIFNLFTLYIGKMRNINEIN